MRTRKKPSMRKYADPNGRQMCTRNVKLMFFKFLYVRLFLTFATFAFTVTLPHSKNCMGFLVLHAIILYLITFWLSNWAITNTTLPRTTNMLWTLLLLMNASDCMRMLEGPAQNGRGEVLQLVQQDYQLKNKIENLKASVLLHVLQER